MSILKHPIAGLRPRYFQPRIWLGSGFAGTRFYFVRADSRRSVARCAETRCPDQRSDRPDAQRSSSTFQRCAYNWPSAPFLTFRWFSAWRPGFGHLPTPLVPSVRREIPRTDLPASNAWRMNIDNVAVDGYSRSRCSGRCDSVTPSNSAAA